MTVYDELFVVVTFSNIRQSLEQFMQPKSPILQKSNNKLKGDLPTEKTNNYCTADIPWCNWRIAIKKI